MSKMHPTIERLVQREEDNTFTTREYEAALLHSWREFGGSEEDFSVRHMMVCAGIREEVDHGK